MFRRTEPVTLWDLDAEGLAKLVIELNFLGDAGTFSENLYGPRLIVRYNAASKKFEVPLNAHHTDALRRKFFEGDLAQRFKS